MKIPFADKLIPKEVFKQKEKYCLGVDIGSNTIKSVKLKFSEDKAELTDFSLEASKLDNLDNLKKIKTVFGLNSVNTAVSGPSTVIRYVNFPRMSEKELGQALKFEAQKHIPFSLDEVNLDSSILKEDSPDNKMLILLAATKQEAVEQRVKMLEEAGFAANLIEIDSVSLVNAFNYNYAQDEALKNKAVALLNIGASVTNLNILENCLPRLSRDIHLAGDDFTHKIKDVLAIEFKAAEEIKLNPEQKEFAKVLPSLEAIYTNLCTSVRTSFDYYESQSASSVAKIYLSGGGSRLKGLKDSVVSLLGIEVEEWDPLKQLSLGENIDKEKLAQALPQLAVAVGLALRQ